MKAYLVKAFFQIKIFIAKISEHSANRNNDKCDTTAYNNLNNQMLIDDITSDPRIYFIFSVCKK